MGQTRKQKIKITMGIELETYSIALPENRICRELQFPKRSIIEKGERFIRDWSIGSEFNSKAFTTIREAFFLLKNSLRKYSKFEKTEDPKDRHVVFPIGGWTDRFAGCHIHLGIGSRGIPYDEAKKLAAYLHDYIPFLIVIAANSPVWRERFTNFASSRLHLGTKKYFRISKRGVLSKVHYRELNFNRGSKKKTRHDGTSHLRQFHPGIRRRVPLRLQSRGPQVAQKRGWAKPVDP